MNDSDKGFYGGICAALQIASAYDQGTVWADIVRACGFENIKEYVTVIEPDDFELIEFKKYAKSEFGKTVRKPK